jgi:hypothetical protein
MSLIKIYAGFLLLTVLLLIGLNFFSAGKDQDTEQEQETKISEGEIAPWEEWSEILIGKWEVKFTIEGIKSILDVEGKATFNRDGTYVDILLYDYYDHPTPGKVARNMNHLSEKGKLTALGKFGLIGNDNHKFISRNIEKWPSCGLMKFHYDPNSLNMCLIFTEVLTIIGNEENSLGDVFQLITFTDHEIILNVDHTRLEQPIIITFRKIEN